ncbi:MAG: diguanylate cyclase [Clostridium sp.]
MNNIENNRQKKINEILSIVKISSLLFSAIAFFNYLFEKTIKENMTQSYDFVLIFISVILFSVVYALWNFANKSKFGKYKNILDIIEYIIFISIVFISILLSGAHESDYKFLFLFIIITATIQGGMKIGVVIAVTASVLILGTDLMFAPNEIVNVCFQNDLIMVGVFILTAWPLGFYVRTEDEHIEELRYMANVDGLTGTYNHRYFHDKLSEEIALKQNEPKSIALMFIDIDYFKQYNDTYGHQQGDFVLKQLGELLINWAGEDYIVARYGGEEFAIILRNTSQEQAVILAENLRKSIEDKYFEGEENQPSGKITVSIGVSHYPTKAKNDIELIKSADNALYRAKFFRKNRVETYNSILDELKNDLEEKDEDLVTSIKTLISVINAKDKCSYTHIERVVIYSKLMAEELKLEPDKKKMLIYGAYMHDIGKINIAKEILIKNTPLSKEEWEILKQHPTNGVEIIQSVKCLDNIATLILYHHERYDGTGYPEKLKGTEIPYLARVLTVIDSFDAMTSHRPYNKRKTYEEGFEELLRCSGSQFDTEIVKTFIKVIKKNIKNM